MSVDSNRKRIGDEERSQNDLDHVLDGFQENCGREEAAESDLCCSTQDRREKIEELYEEHLTVIEELQRRRKRVEVLSEQLADLEHKAQEAEISRNFVCATGIVISSADAHARRVRSRLELLRRQQKNARNELQRAVEREQLIRGEMQSLKLKKDAPELEERQKK